MGCGVFVGAASAAKVCNGLQCICRSGFSREKQNGPAAIGAEAPPTNVCVFERGSRTIRYWCALPTLRTLINCRASSAAKLAQYICCFCRSGFSREKQNGPAAIGAEAPPTNVCVLERGVHDYAHTLRPSLPPRKHVGRISRRRHPTYHAPAN